MLGGWSRLSRFVYEFNCKDIGKIIKLMEKENFCMQIKLYMREIGNLIRLMDMEFLSTQTRLDILANGKMTFNMDMEKKIGLMVQYIKEISKKVKSTDKVHL
jgi:hypothetical protein